MECSGATAKPPKAAAGGLLLWSDEQSLSSSLVIWAFIFAYAQS